MRTIVLAVMGAVALWCAPAAADTIVQNVSGTNRSGTFLNLFDPSLGTLDSVQIDGSVSFYEDLLRTGDPTSFPAINAPRTASESLIHSIPATTAATATVTGNEVYAAGSSFGSISLSGSLFALLTGSGVDQFLVAGGRTTDLFTPQASVVPTVGQILPNPASPGGSYSVAVTYFYTPVPEPSSWAMMLLGFAAIGMVLHNGRGPARLTVRR